MERRTHAQRHPQTTALLRSRIRKKEEGARDEDRAPDREAQGLREFREGAEGPQGTGDAEDPQDDGRHSEGHEAAQAAHPDATSRGARRSRDGGQEAESDRRILTWRKTGSRARSSIRERSI